MYPYFPADMVGSPTGFQNYNALMAQLQRSYSNGLLFNVHYTWSTASELWGSEAQMNQYLENAGFTNNTIDRSIFGIATRFRRTTFPIASWQRGRPSCRLAAAAGLASRTAC